MSIVEKTGIVPERLANAPALPVGLEQLWHDFTDLHSCRGSTGFGPERITFQDIDCWSRVTGATLEGWQIEAIRKADNAFLASVATKAKLNG